MFELARSHTIANQLAIAEPAHVFFPDSTGFRGKNASY
jgi:hypothetical protein